MDYGAVLWGAVAFVLAGTVPTVAGAQKAMAAPSLVFDRVTVVDVENGKLVPAQRVVIVGNRIQTMGNEGAVKTPAGAQVVDARGKYLIPGLWDMHTHTYRSTELFYPLFLANGVTGIRDAGSPVPLDTLRQWRREILAGRRVGPPRQLLSGPSLAGPVDGCKRGPEHQTCVVDTADARHVVDSLKAAGADIIKPRAVSAELYFAIAAEARRQGIPFGGHAASGSFETFGGGLSIQWNGPKTVIEASDSGARIIDHGNFQEELHTRCFSEQATVEQCQPLVERFRRNHTWVELDNASVPGVAGYNERMGEFWADSLRPGKWLSFAAAVKTYYLEVAERAGLPIVAGTDVAGDYNTDRWSPDHGFGLFPTPGFLFHDILAWIVANGMTPAAALRAATLNPAKMLGTTDSLGTVATGKLADLVLLDADPLADITNTTTIRAVVANGRYFDRAALDQLLTATRAKVQQQKLPAEPSTP